MRNVKLLNSYGLRDFAIELIFRNIPLTEHYDVRVIKLMQRNGCQASSFSVLFDCQVVFLSSFMAWEDKNVHCLFTAFSFVTTFRINATLVTLP